MCIRDRSPLVPVNIFTQVLPTAAPLAAEHIYCFTAFMSPLIAIPTVEELVWAWGWGFRLHRMPIVDVDSLLVSDAITHILYTVVVIHL